MSPYTASATEIVARFATSPERINLLRGLFDLRAEIRRIGIDAGFQWVDGSFVEDVEALRGRPPQDIDVVTFAHRPTRASDPVAWAALWRANPAVFDPGHAKATYRCEAFFIDLSMRPDLLVDRSRYWFGLFSHQRVTETWKGMLKIPLVSDDAAAVAALT